MISLIIFSTVSNLIFLLIGQIYFWGRNLNKKNKLNNFYEQCIFGFIITSFFSVLLNFITPLNQSINSLFIIFIILLVIIFQYKKIFKHIKIIILFLTLSSFLTFSLICLDNIYRPDAGLYHYPFIKILNTEKIVIGISNLYYAYGTSSIIQYTSAIFNNYLFKENGMVLPLANLISAILLYLISEIIDKIKKNKIDFSIVFLSIIILYISYKFARYSEYGNDGPAHLLFFYLIYKIIKINKKFSDEEYIKLILISIFIFFIKITMMLTLLFPILFFKLKKIKIYFYNKKFIFIVLFILIWFSKNILNTGCLIYPINLTCFKNLKWFNDKNVKEIVLKRQEIEAWSKGWIDQKEQNKIESFNEYNINFNWIKSWSEKNLIKILEILLPFICFLWITLILAKYINNKSKRKKIFYLTNNIKIAVLVSVLGIFFWFLNFPTFRFGTSYIITLIAILFAIFFVKNIPQNNLTIVLKFFLVVSLTIFLFKQAIRIYKNSNNYYYNYPWPKFYSFADNIKQVNRAIYKNGKIIYYYNDLGACMYSDSLCTHIKPNNQINYVNKFNYKIFF